MSDQPLGSGRITLPGRAQSPARALGWRALLALALVVIIALLTYADREGFRDGGSDTPISLLDAFYYATVSITTTGYGDITPVSDGARLMTTVVTTPLRILFLILLVGTTVEFLTASSVRAYREQRWRRSVKHHTVICGFGTTGRSAAAALLRQGAPREEIVVVDGDPETAAEAIREGFVTVTGDASRTTVLEQASIEAADSVIVAVGRDDTAALVTLTVRELNSHASLVAAVTAQENAVLLRHGGADAVVASKSTAGRMLGLAARQPQVGEVVDDLMTIGDGLDIAERAVLPAEIGRPPQGEPGSPVIGVIREGRLLRLGTPECAVVQEGDRIVELRPGGPVAPGQDLGPAVSG